MADQLCTTAQVKNRLQNAAAGVAFSATDTTTIGELIDQVSDWIQEFTGRKLVPEAGATYVVDTSAGSTIEIKRGIRAVTTLSIATTDQPDAGGVYTAVAAADILLRPASIDRKPGWPAMRILIRGSSAGILSPVLNGAKIVGDFGFAVTPPAIAAVTIDAVVAAFQSRKNGASGVIGADGNAIVPWGSFFSRGSPQRGTLERFRYMGIG